MGNRNTQLIPPAGTRAEYWTNADFDTMCVLYDKHGHELVHGVARLNAKDEYNAQLGCEIALGRARKELIKEMAAALAEFISEIEVTLDN